MKLIPFQEKDFDGLYEFMRPLWHETYGGFLPKEQIDFLLDKYFSAAGLRHFRALGYEYRKIDDIGVVVFVDRGEHIYMDKLYLLPAARGKGYASFVFSELAKFGKDIVLSANQRNERALKCYRKNGFTIEEEKAVELENGMVNYDYILRKKI